MSVVVSIVVPVYNEEQSLQNFLSTLRGVLDEITAEYEVIFAADPCTDRTIDILKAEHAKDPRIKLLLFSRRFGQPAATMGGLNAAQGEAVIVIDCDLQDPPALIPDMLRLWRSGYKVVIPQRRTREGEHVIKRLVAFSGYWLINKIATVPIPRNTGDFRLLDRRVVDELVKLNESHGFLRGLTSVVGFKTHLLPFDRDARVAGSGKYNRLTGSLRIGFNGIVAFSDYLLNMMVTAGFALAAFSMVLIVVVAWLKYVGAYDFTAGLATTAILLLFLGGVQLTAMGVLGSYVGRIYDESKRRPKFIVDEAVGIQSDSPAIEHAAARQAAIDRLKL